tara:strand:+ start:478 stop:903 length:426 start_codon:yes stop_codon:yes gene_type:complete
MATINASITIASDITSNPITISKSMVLKKFQSNVGLEETTGLQAKKFTATTAVKIIDHADGTPAKSNKVYIRNTGTNNEHFFYVSLNASAAAADTTETIGKLYAGDWMLMPWTATNATSHDIFVAPSTTAAMTLEFMLFQE